MAIESFRDFISSIDGKFQDRTAIECVERDKSIKAWSYNQFISDIKAVANYYIEKGYVGKHIGVCLESNYEDLIYMYAGFYAGCVVTLLHYDFNEDKLILNAKRADLEVLITDREIKTDIDIYDTKNGFPISEITHELKPLGGDDCACILYTSGTSSIEKMVMLSQRSIIHILNLANAYTVPDGTVTYCVHPFSHAAAFGVMVSLYLGITTCYMVKAKYFFRDLKLVNPHTISIVPTFLETICKKLNNGDELKNVVGDRCYNITIGASSAREELLDILNERKIAYTCAYGLTETAGFGSIYISSNCSKKGTVGKPNIAIKIENDEILMQGPSIMLGYYKDEEATNKALVDGWLHTGDIGYIDEEGYVFLTGRMSNIIKLSNGKKISPEEIEGNLLKCEMIEEVLVKGEDDMLVAYIYTEEQDKSMIDEFIKKYNGSVESYKRIHRIKYTDSPLTKTLTGKIKRG